MEIKLELFNEMTVQIQTEDMDYFKLMLEEFTRYVQGFQFTPKYRTGRWNGKICMINEFRRTFPYGILLDYIRVHRQKFPRNPLTVSPEVKKLFSGPEMNISYNLKYSPRPYQKDCVEAALKHTKGIIRSATASGKSLVIAYIILNLLENGQAEKAIIIVPNKSLIAQFYQDLVDYGIDADVIGMVFAKRKQWNKDIVISTWQSLGRNKKKIDMFDCIICDECLSGNTKIQTANGIKLISNIKKGDEIISYNIKKNIFEYDNVVDTYKNMIFSSKEKMYEIEFDNGNILKITGNHKLLTTEGYKSVNSIINENNINRYEFIEHKANEMNTRSLKLIIELNKILENNNQNLRIIYYKSDKIKLSNGLSLYKNNCKKLIRRIKSTNNLYTIHFDCLYSRNKKTRNEKEKFLKTIHTSKGGLSCQKKHSEKINLNLNNGIPWNKGKKIYYKVWNKGKNKKTDKRLKRLAENRMGPGNPMYGKKMPEKTKEKLSDIMKKKILDGSFTPNIHNSLSHKKINVNGINFRSAWEAVYYLLNENLEYETIRIPYTNYKNKKSVYIVDFINYATKKLIEIKPKSHQDSHRFKLKKAAAKLWCNNNGLEFIVIDEKYFIKHEKKIKKIKNCDIKNKVLKMIKNENKKNKRNRKI